MTTAAVCLRAATPTALGASMITSFKTRIMVLCSFAVGLHDFNAFNRFFNECAKEKLCVSSEILYWGFKLLSLFTYFEFELLKQRWMRISEYFINIIAFMWRNQLPERQHLSSNDPNAMVSFI